MSPAAADGTPGPVEAVAVVVPVRNEERLLRACLDSLSASVDALGGQPVWWTRVVVVVDRCTDRSAAIAAQAGAQVLTSEHGRVGAARALGTGWALAAAAAAGADPGRTWLASTDADGVVPADWLQRQLALADAGADCVVGTVEPDGLAPELLREWASRHHLGEGHPHVHGANLGLRASTYELASGFADVGVHEDRDLVARVRACGARVVATDSTRVRTSGRLRSRVVGGFADYLRQLAGHEGVA